MMRQAHTLWMLAQFRTQASHHDPLGEKGTNRSMFLRRKQRVVVGQTGRAPSQVEIDQVCVTFPVPVDIAPFFENLTLAQFVGASLAKEFVMLYGAGDGTGLFAGMERYRFLQTRFQQSAVEALNLFEFWGIVCKALNVGISPEKHTRRLLSLLTLSPVLGNLVLGEIVKHSVVIVLMGQEWAKMTKRQDEAYCTQAKLPQANPENAVLQFGTVFSDDDVCYVDVPAYSANSARHELIREPGMWHLLDALGLELSELTKGARALLYNGNNIKKGSKAPTSASRTVKQIRALYPHIGLIGGCADWGMLGESTLSVHCWFRCKENNVSIDNSDYHSKVSAFDMLDRVQHNRHTLQVDPESAMMMTFESLAQGSELAVRLHLSPYHTRLERGAMVAAVETFVKMDSTLGGQTARGFGLVDLQREWSQDDSECLQEYEDYLRANRDTLRQGLLDGKLGTDKICCA